MDQDLRDRLLAMDTMAVFEVMSHYLDRVGHQLQQARTTHSDGLGAAWIEAQLGALRDFGEQVPFENESMADATAIASRWSTAAAEVLAALPKPEADPDLLTVVVTPDEVAACSTGPVLGLLTMLLESPARARSRQGVLDLRISGYDTHPAELSEIPEVRTYIQQLGREFPYWLYFASTKSSSLQMIALCHLPPGLTKNEKRAQFPIRLHDLLMGRWIPALNEMAEFAGLAPEVLREVSDRAIGYFSTTAAV
ncbi:hypothetical protein RHCRD62_30366 [Rhodococcus sp. RD6.2]|uniref:hypothetical protein n=1 Tax=Rhodococcus sp. RD6.2 TaxID=260936 RepID=UPI00063BB2F0|nr:hypothetical protein [Rhodococcus sp. RD6.2]CRK51702.1 hypothetical protein RHCRD62_30366 [Rhodococcus sp. RD6.2]